MVLGPEPECRPDSSFEKEQRLPEPASMRNSNAVGPLGDAAYPRNVRFAGGSGSSEIGDWALLDSGAVDSPSEV